MIIQRDAEFYGIECKRTDAPKMTPSISHALNDLNLNKVAVIYPGPKRYSLTDQVEAVPLAVLGSGSPLFD